MFMTGRMFKNSKEDSLVIKPWRKDSAGALTLKIRQLVWTRLLLSRLITHPDLQLLFFHHLDGEFQIDTCIM